jgi:hypothetical protein
MGGSPLGHWRQIVNCTFWGYYGGIESGSAEYSLIQGNRFVHMGGGNLNHAIYISGPGTWPPPPGTLSQHTIVDNNIFVAGGGGYAIHFFHNNRTGIITRNGVFGPGHYGLVFDGEEVLAANNFVWRGYFPATPTSTVGFMLAYVTNNRGVWENNVSSLSFWNPGSAPGLRDKNAFENDSQYNGNGTGTNVILLTPGQEAAQLGLLAASIDSNIATLDTAFSHSNATILADTTIEPAFATLKTTIPTGGPLYRTGAPWFDTNPINVGPNSGAPATINAFWAAFRALGLKEYDANGNIIP